MFGHKPHNSNQPLKSVKLVKDAAGGPAVSLSKIEQEGGVSLRKKTEAVTVSLQKRNIGGIRAQVVVVLDHSGSMYGDYSNHKVQDLVERFLGFALTVDIDGSVPVIAFDSRVHPAVDVTMANYHNVVQDKIWKPNGMGSTDLAAALKEVEKVVADSDAPVYCAVVTDGNPDDRSDTTEIVCKLAAYPVFLKFLAVQPVPYLDDLDDLPDNKRLLDNVDTKAYLGNLSSVSDEQFAEDMAEEYDSWVSKALEKGILYQ